MPRIVSVLAKRRMKAGYPTAQDAAPKLKVSRVHLLKVESGQGTASEELIQRMARLYEADAEDVRRELRKERKAALHRMLESA